LTAVAGVAGIGVAYDTDPSLLARVLACYRPNCRYLKAAKLTADGDPGDGGRLTLRCEFAIAESCYIDDTGHFNSVEFNICYNQMMYYAVAKSVQEKLMEPFSAWTVDEYWKRQLADFLITDFRSTFKRPLDARQFSGEMVVTDVVRWEASELRPALTVLRTTCRYYDGDRGNCHGAVEVAVTGATP
jgi:hypothetical protein